MQKPNFNIAFPSDTRPVKWHIYNVNHEPLCWNEKALEFNSKESAKEFLTSAINSEEHSYYFFENLNIIEDILHYSGGYLDATNLQVIWDYENCETRLIFKEAH